MLVLISAAVVVLVACAAIFALIFTQIGQVVSNEVPAMQKTVEDFIRAGVRQDIETGYALFAPAARQQFELAKVKEMFDKTQLFDQFTSTTVTSFNINSNVATSSGTATAAQVEGTITYGKDTGTFKAELMKVGDRWMLFNINITH